MGGMCRFVGADRCPNNKISKGLKRVANDRSNWFELFRTAKMAKWSEHSKRSAQPSLYGTGKDERYAADLWRGKIKKCK